MDRWMVIWTRPSHEFVVVDRLREIGFDAFAPAIRKERPIHRFKRNRGRGKVIMEPYLTAAFPRYIVFSATEKQPVWQRAIRENGVTLVVRRAGDAVEPGILPEKVVTMLRGPEGDGVIKDLTTTVQNIERYVEGQRIRVTSGPYISMGVVVGQDGRNVRAILSLLNREVEAVVPVDNVEAA